MRNDLHIPSMKHNYISTFILMGSGLTVRKVPNIRCDEPMLKYHSIYDDVTKLRIHLKFDDILFYLPTRALTLEEMQRCDEIEHVFLLPYNETWDPYSETYALNKVHIVDAGGEIVYPPPQAREVFEPMEVEYLRAEPLDKIVEQVPEENGMFSMIK